VASGTAQKAKHAKQRVIPNAARFAVGKDTTLLGQCHLFRGERERDFRKEGSILRNSFPQLSSGSGSKKYFGIHHSTGKNSGRVYDTEDEKRVGEAKTRLPRGRVNAQSEAGGE